MSVSGRAPPPGGCAPPGTRSGREAWPLGPFGGVAAARPPAGRGAVRHGAAPACAHCHGVQGHAGRRRKCRRGILFAPDDALDYMGCHPRGTRGRPRSHAGRGGASLPVTGRVGVRPSLTCITRPCRARYSWPMHLRAYAQLLWVLSSAPAPSVGSMRPVASSHPRWGNFPICACEGAGAAPLHRLPDRRARRWVFLDQRWTPAESGRHRRRARAARAKGVSAVPLTHWRTSGVVFCNGAAGAKNLYLN